MPRSIPHRAALALVPVEEAAWHLEELRRDLVRHALAHARSDGEHRTAMPGLTIWRAAAGHQPGHIVHRPALAVVLQGVKRVRLADEVSRQAQ